jgi:hypothetical protein
MSTRSGSRPAAPTIAVVAIGCAMAVALGAQSARIDVKKSDRPILEAARAYVAAYQDQLAFVLADEAGIQRVRNAAGLVTATRETRSEVFFVFVPGDKAWLAVRQVKESDGRPVTTQQDIRALLSTSRAVNVAGELKRANAQFNIGRISRNFNEPTLGLFVLDGRFLPQFKFSRSKDAVVDGEPVSTFTFKETDRPTLIRGPNYADVFSTGTLVVESATGRIRATHLELKTGSLRAEQTTTYVIDEKLGIRVPKVFTERYEQTAKGMEEVDECEAVYSGFRRFEVTGRIK